MLKAGEGMDKELLGFKGFNLDKELLGFKGF